MRYVEIRRHTMRLKPGQHLSQAGVNLARRVGAAMGPFERVITSPIPRAYETAIAMGFAVHEQVEWLGLLEDGVEAEVGSWDAGFGAYGRAFRAGGVLKQQATKLGIYVREIAALLPEETSALLITHGGLVEAGAVACLPDADHDSWGQFCSYCEGVGLHFDGRQFVEIDILRIG